MPAEGTSTESPVLIEGYARTFESNVLIIATAGDQVVAEEFTTAADSVATWGQFRAQVELPPGETALFIGDENQEDGGLEGVTIGIFLR
ncbi:MAG: Gmad2 immunoglobulin-like domain-containing protein, partial [Acidimicrobiia bacterium]